MPTFDPFDDEIVLSTSTGLTADIVRNVVASIPVSRIRTEPFVGRNPQTGEAVEIEPGSADIQVLVDATANEWIDIGGLRGNMLRIKWYYGDLSSPDKSGHAILEFIKAFCLDSRATSFPPLNAS